MLLLDFPAATVYALGWKWVCVLQHSLRSPPQDGTAGITTFFEIKPGEQIRIRQPFSMKKVCTTNETCFHIFICRTRKTKGKKKMTKN